MKVKKISRNVMVILFLGVFFLGCSDGDNKDSSTSPNKEDLKEITRISQITGTYNLIDFEIEYANGSKIDSSDMISFSGTMEIGSDGTVTQKIQVNGEAINVVSSVEIIEKNTWHVKIPECTFDVALEYYNEVLTTILPLGACGYDFKETDVWQKVSTKKAPSSITGEFDGYGVLGGSVGCCNDLN